MTNLVVNQVADVAIDVVSDDLININLVEQPSVNVQFDVAQGPSGPKGDEGSVTQEMLSVLSQATAQASLAQGYASAASSVVQQDLSGVNSAALHRSPNAVTAMFVYDTSKDSDGGAWTEKCQHTSWYNEPINGKWLGAQPNELSARNKDAILSDTELVTNGDFSNGTTGWTASTSAVISNVDGRLKIVTSSTNQGAYTTVTCVIGKTYLITANGYYVGSSPVRMGVGSQFSQGQEGDTAANITSDTQLSLVFVATRTSEVVWLFASTAGTSYYDNISVREVTAQTTQTGDYFQLTTDGKFYRLNAGSGITEVFRGNKRDFPRLAGIVAEAASVTIYDLTESGRPMWARWDLSPTGFSIDYRALAAVNGQVTVGSGSGCWVMMFPGDKVEANQSSGHALGRLTNHSKQAYQTISTTARIVNNGVNAVAMTVLPDAPVDPATGLQVPTIAVGTGNGVSVIQHNGTVTTIGTSSTSLGAGALVFDNSKLIAGRAAGGNPLFRSLGQKLVGVWGLGGNNHWGYFNSRTLIGGALGSYGNWPAGVGLKIFDPSKAITNVTNGLNAGITPTHNTGYMTGDIRRAYLSDIDAGSVGTELVTNGTFASGLTNWTPLNQDTSVDTSSGSAVFSSPAGLRSLIAQTIPTVAGKQYRVTFSKLSGAISNGAMAVDVWRDNWSSPKLYNANYGALTAGTYSFVFSATSSAVVLGFDLPAGNTGASFTIDNVSMVEVVSDRSYKAKGANITGTLTKSAVASAAQLVAYSGFSAANYLREPYSADLDFGTGEWSVGAWVNVPVTLPVESFPVVGPELFSTFSTIASPWVDAGGGVYSIDGSQTTSSDLSGWSGFVSGKQYVIDLTISGVFGYISSTYPNAYSSGKYLYLGGHLIFRANPGVVGLVTINSVREIDPVAIADRAHSSGARVKIGLDAAGRLTATAFDGTTTRTVTTTAAYKTGTWLKAEADYTTDGTLSISVNGVEVAATRGNPLLSLNNSNAVLTIGNSYNLDAPFPGSIALLKFSATVPTAEQSVWMYEQEKQMFRDGAQICLPDSGSIVDLTYDDATDKWIAISATNESEWSGLIRTSVTASPAGSYSKASSASGIQLLARTTTNPGVDVTIPSYGLREELVRRSESAAKLNARLATFDYVGGFTANTTSGSTAITSASGLTYPTSYIGARISGSGIPANTFVVAVSGTTIYISAAATATASSVQISFIDFILPVGYEARVVQSSGQNRTEGSTKDYIRLFDGFKETIRFNTAPGYTAAVQIQAGSSR